MKKTGIVIGIVVLIVITAIAIGVNKKTNSNKQSVQKEQISKKVNKRNEALRYVSHAHFKAKRGDLEAALAACDKALAYAPNEPAATSCRKRVEIMKKKKK